MNLEQIAKQVSLLNRLIELLRMQDNQFEVTRYSGDFVEYSEEEFNSLQQEDKYNSDGERLKKYVSRPPEYLGKGIQDTDGKSLTQQAWSDELVKVAKEIHTSYGQETWRIECYCPGMDVNYYLVGIIHSLFQTYGKGWVSANLEAILNKYGRSLTG